MGKATKRGADYKKVDNYRRVLLDAVFGGPALYPLIRKTPHTRRTQKWAQMGMRWEGMEGGGGVKHSKRDKNFFGYRVIQNVRNHFSLEGVFGTAKGGYARPSLYRDPGKKICNPKLRHVRLIYLFFLNTHLKRKTKKSCRKDGRWIKWK